MPIPDKNISLPTNGKADMVQKRGFWFRCANGIPAFCMIVMFLFLYYAYIVELCILLISNQMKMIIYIVVGTILFLFVAVTYFMAMCDRNSTVPSMYYFPNEFFDRLLATKTDSAETSMLVQFCRERDLLVFTRTKSGLIRYCVECGLLKPDRTHHCSTCGSCILKMDHHCPWINNCVGFRNYKYFLTTVLYAANFCTYCFATSLEYLIDFCLNFRMDRLRETTIVALCVLGLGLGIVLYILFCFHVRLILVNQTTIEAIHPPTFISKDMTFDLGTRRNFYENCGNGCCCWVIPMNTHQGDGCQFEISRIGGSPR